MQSSVMYMPVMAEGTVGAEPPAFRAAAELDLPTEENAEEDGALGVLWAFSMA